jgi:hypothetical protein
VYNIVQTTTQQIPSVEIGFSEFTFTVTGVNPAIGRTSCRSGKPIHGRYSPACFTSSQRLHVCGDAVARRTD